MQQFKIEKERYKELRKRALFTLVPVYFSVILLVTVIPILKPGANGVDISTLPFTLILLIAVFGFIIYRNIDKQKKILESYTLVIDKNLIAREMLNSRPIAIYFNEISSIAKNKKGSLIVKGKSSDDIITIPAQIENYNQIESTLKEIKPFDARPSLTFLQKYPMVISLLIVVLFAVFYLSENNFLTCISGIAIASILVWSFYKIRTNKNISNKAKQNSWLILLISVSIIVTMVMKLIGKQ